MKTGFLFQVWPYTAAALFAIGLTFRFGFARGRTGIAMPRWGDLKLAGSGRIMNWSLSVLFLGHLAGLLFAQRVLLWNSVPARLYALEAVAFAAGLAALVAVAIVIWRHLGQSDGSVFGQLADTILLSLLLMTLLSGLLAAVLYRWSSSWGVLTLTPYVLSLLRGRPAVTLAAGTPFLVQLHVFSAFSALALLPATRVAPILVAVLARSLHYVLALVHALTDPGRKRLEAALGKYSPTVWIWPEED